MVAAAVMSAMLAIYSSNRTFTGWSAGASVTVVIGAVVLAAGVAAMVLGRFVAIAGGALSIWAFVTFAAVNPLYSGLGPLTDSPLAGAVQGLAAEQPGAHTLVLANPAAAAIVRSSGLQVVSGQTVYPNRDFWERVLPGEDALWNNYRNYLWEYDPSANPIVGTVTDTDSAVLRVDICSPQLAQLRLAYVIAPAALVLPCGNVREQVEFNDTIYSIWELPPAGLG